MTASKQRIGIFGNFGGSNLGNEGTLEAMIIFLRQARADAELVCLCSEPKSVAEQYCIAALPFHCPRHPSDSFLDKIKARLGDLMIALKYVRELDVLIVPGTGILDDFGEPPQGMPLTIFWVCLAARLRGIKVCFVSIGAGPIENPLSRWLMKSAASLAYYRSYRDTASRRFMRNLGVDVEHDEVYPDLAFKLPEPAAEPVREDKQQRTIGVGVMAYSGWRAAQNEGRQIYDTYIEKITRFVSWLLDRGYRVRILIGEQSDKRAVDDLTRGIVTAGTGLPLTQLVAESASSLHELMRQIIETDIVVATRFHNVVCALKVGRPTISLSYAEKNDALLTEFGLAQFCQHVEKFDLDLLINQVTKLLSDRSTYVDQIRRTNLALNKRLLCQDAVLETKIIPLRGS
jgi:polysaccharide pyruvyl transferase WcaK-like protein